jgi:hypothetical protein
LQGMLDSAVMMAIHFVAELVAAHHHITGKIILTTNSILSEASMSRIAALLVAMSLLGLDRENSKATGLVPAIKCPWPSMQGVGTMEFLSSPVTAPLPLACVSSEGECACQA